MAPADTWVGLPASGDGPFPTVLHSHGFSGNLRFGNQHNAAVASWGYVVAAVDHPERGLASILDAFLAGDADERERPDEYLDSDQLIAGLDLLAETNEQADSPIAGAVDTEQVAAEGHSAGGSASGTAAYDDRVDLWIGQAPVTPLEPDTDLDAVHRGGRGRGRRDPRSSSTTTPCSTPPTPPDVPSLIIAAEGDTIVDARSGRCRPTTGSTRPSAWPSSPTAATPCSSTRACRSARRAGSSGFVESLGLDPDDVPLVELGENGCLPADTDPEAVWGLIDHLTVAQLNQVFGIDTDVATASLDPDYLDETFPGLLQEIVTN